MENVSSEENGNIRIKRSLSYSEEEDGFLGFDTGIRGLIIKSSKEINFINLYF